MPSHIKTKEKLTEYLNRMNIAVLSTATTDGHPHAAVVYFIVDPKLNFYFLTYADTKKAKNLEKNKHVALTTIDLKPLISIQSTGVIEKITDPQKYTQIVTELGDANARKNSLGWPPPLAYLEKKADIIVYQYTPTWIQVADYSVKFNPNEEGKTESVFTEIAL